jgi:hypothetical protein
MSSRLGLNFTEIAGNSSFVLVSLLAPDSWQSDGSTLLTQPILTQPGMRRVLVTLPVDGLADAMRRWNTARVQVEHVFDY